jgi:hypothetical protein
MNVVVINAGSSITGRPIVLAKRLRRSVRLLPKIIQCDKWTQPFSIPRQQFPQMPTFCAEVRHGAVPLRCCAEPPGLAAGGKEAVSGGLRHQDKPKLVRKEQVA